ncbi:hypothetical protein NDU88_005268 [Pleurodeles waltl]|uniref:Uncharacterized protein n=1 Tax=Pleurodeles waltl TaxID=8319 RepID=A0AAV7VN21_PLEWA|nr:hypothetical protein NDU88_005268 [Pleurodeles waltl]
MPPRSYRGRQSSFCAASWGRSLFRWLPRRGERQQPCMVQRLWLRANVLGAILGAILCDGCRDEGSGQRAAGVCGA